MSFKHLVQIVMPDFWNKNDLILHAYQLKSFQLKLLLQEKKYMWLVIFYEKFYISHIKS